MRHLLLFNQTFKSKRNYILIGGLVLCSILTSCRSSSFYIPKNVDVYTEPYATIFWEDGQRITKANNVGHASVGVSEYMYRKGHKKIIVAKAGYEPQTIALQSKFNKRVLYNIFFPYGFIWGHYKTIDYNKTNNVLLATRAKNDAQSYLDMANGNLSKRKQTELLRNAIYQDPDNENGIAILSLNALSDLCYANKDYEKSKFWADNGKWIAPKDVKSHYNSQRAKNAIIEKAERKKRRAETWNTILSTASTALSTAATIASNGNSDTYSNSTSSSAVSSSRKNRQGQKGGSVSDAQNERTSRKAYNDYVSQLIDMNTRPELNNDSQRRNIQSAMRKIRQRWGFPKSEWENWNGVQK